MSKKLVAVSFGLLLAGAELALAQTPSAPAPVAGPATCCSAGVLGGDACCDPGRRFYVSAEYLLWWIKDSRLPPAVEDLNVLTFNAIRPLQSLVVPGFVTVSDGGPDVDNEARSGGRFMAGYWFGDDRSLGVEGGYLFLGARSVNATLVTDITQQLPGVSNIPVTLQSRLQGAEGNLVGVLADRGTFRLDWLAGFRWFQLHEGLHLNKPAEEVRGIIDGDFEEYNSYQGTLTCQNNFYGGQIGLKALVQRGPISVEGVAKIALGGTHEEVNIAGAQIQSNDVHFNDKTDRFAVVPELGINVGWDITPSLRAYVGYSFLWISNVVRTGDQVVVVSGVTTLPTATPQLTGPGSSDFWAQGLSFGLELHY